jgi:ABC-type transport system involved in multi-copper enzyme maturation permease subunit
MFTIARHEFLAGFMDAKFIFLAALVLCTFCANGIIYSEWYQQNYRDWNESTHNTSAVLEQRAYSLQQVADYPQVMVKPPSALAFLADGGEKVLPNAIGRVNASFSLDALKYSRGNKALPVIGSLDWDFIVGTLMSLLAVLISYNAVCGEKAEGTLRMVLAQPVSRLALFLGKYCGMLLILMLTFLVGALLNILILVINNALPLNEHTLTAIGWSMLFTCIFLSCAVLSGMTISAVVSRPAVSLVLMMIGWVVFVVAVPGIARLIAEKTVQVRSPFDLEKELSSRLKEIADDIPTEGKSWGDDPHAENIPIRGEWFRRRTEAEQRVQDESNAEKIRQADLVMQVGSISPMGIFGSAMQTLSGTGVSGYKLLLKTAKRYQQQLYAFTVERDQLDPDSPHLIYYSQGSDTGVISTRPVQMSSIPRSQQLWYEGGLSPDQEKPWFQLILLVVFNVQFALLGFWALTKYDPR